MSEEPRRPRRRPRQGGNDEDHSLSSALDAYLVSQGLSGARELADVGSCWTAIVGDNIAAHAVPTAIRDGELIVSVDHPSWATELSFLSGGILEQLAEQLGYRVAQRVKVHVRRNPSLD